jgi:hypothetical protein
MMHDSPVDSYIVRIYRKKQSRRPILVRVVEEVGAQGRKAFTNPDELWGILNKPKTTRGSRGALLLATG